MWTDRGGQPLRLLGLTVTRQKKSLTTVDNRGGWWPIVRESFAGAWQQNVVLDRSSILANHAVFACQTLIASDIAKLRIKLVKRDDDGVWEETTNPAYSPLLRKPNHFQNRIQFLENWVLSKLQRGNTYALKQRDNRGVVIKTYVLDPIRVIPLVADDGSVFYELNCDRLAGLPQAVIVPASEIIHDRFNCLFHPLVGLSPIFANSLAASQAVNIQKNSSAFFANGSSPGGILVAPGKIDAEAAARLKDYWDNNFTGKNSGKIAVLGDGLKFESMAMKAVDAELVDQLKWTAEVVCSTYHVPPYKIGVGTMPAYTNVQALNVEYYSQCLQVLIESIELCLDEGLGMADGLGTELDVDNLLRMDSVTQVNMLVEAVKGTIMAPNEARKKLDLKKTKGGDSVWSQQQNYSLEALAERDANEPFAAHATPKPAPDPTERTEEADEAGVGEQSTGPAAKTFEVPTELVGDLMRREFARVFVVPNFGVAA